MGETNKEKLRFGIIGYGFMGHTHGRTLQQLDDAEWTAVCEIDEHQLTGIPENVKIYRDMDQLLADENVDVVIISVPNHIHLETVVKAARAGKDILCEKPAALSVKEFDEMMAVVKECGVKFTVHQQRRWDKDFRKAKAVYDGQSLGDIYTVQSMLYGFNGNMHDWHIYPQYGGGMLYDWGVHLLDQMVWMVGSPVKSVYADVRNVINKDVDDYFKIILRFENGVTGEVELGTYFLCDKENWFERHWFIGGNKGSAYIDGFMPEGKIVRTTRLLTNVPGEITMTAGGPTRSFGPPAEGLIVTEPLPDVKTEQIMYFDNFIKGIRGEEEFVVKPEEVRTILCIMEAVRESSRTCKAVELKP